MKTGLLALLAALSSLMPPLWAQELKDAGFETPGKALVSTSASPNAKAEISGIVADGWEDNTNWAYVKLVYSLDTANPHSGRLSQKIDVERGFAQFVQNVAFQPGRYRVSLWMRAQPAQWVSLGLREAGAPYTGYESKAVKVGTSWTQVTAEGLTPAGNGIVIVNTSGIGSLWLDDASLTRPPAASQAVTLAPPKGSIPTVFFGLNANHMHDLPGYRWPALRFGTFRTWDSGVIWPTVEPQRGVYHWDELDKDVAEAERHGVQFLFTLGLTPQWAAPKGPNSYAGVSAPPDDLADRRDFVRAVATRYKGRIAAYEVWNEPDLTQFYSGTAAQLAAVEKVTAEAVHQADPSALVVAPPPSGGLGVGQLRWYDDYLSAGGGQYADVLAVHSYSDPPEGDAEVVRTYRALLAQHGLARKPLWNTETGLELAGHTEQDAAAYLAREFITDWAAGLGRMYFYAYDNGLYFGLDKEDADGKNRDPALLAPSGIAYQEVEKWLIGSRMLSCACDANGTWVCALQRPDCSRARFVWNGNGPTVFPIPADWHMGQFHTLSGASVLTSTRALPIGFTPVLLEAKRP